MHRNRTLLSAAAGALALAALTFSPAVEAQETDPTPSLMANGQGSVDVVPDIAVVSIGVSTRGRTAADALAANSTDLAAVIDVIKAQGVAERDIGTSGFSINPVYQRQTSSTPSDKPPAIVGYDVSNQVRVVIRDIAESGGLLDRVVRAGANQINGISFDIDDPQEAQDEALRAAIADARRQAEMMAEAAGVRLVRVLSVNASSNRGGPVFERAYTVASAASVPVMPGERQITADATVTWEIAPAE